MGGTVKLDRSVGILNPQPCFLDVIRLFGIAKQIAAGGHGGQHRRSATQFLVRLIPGVQEPDALRTERIHKNLIACRATAGRCS